MPKWGNQCGYGNVRGLRRRAVSDRETLAGMERELARRRAVFGDSHPLVREQIGLIACYQKQHPELSQ